MSQSSKVTPSSRFIATLNNPQEKYPDFMAQDWLEAMYKASKAEYVNGQLEKGEEGTVHLQYYVHFAKEHKKRVTALKKLCKFTHWQPVTKDNGASDYCLKEDTRVEGPWEFGKKPLRQYVKGECKEARAEKNKMLMDKDLDELQQTGEIALSQVPMLKRAKDIIEAIRQKKETRPIEGSLEEHNVWMYGDAGRGKTGWIIDYFNDNGGYYEKDKSKYWNNYDQEKNVLIDDIEKGEQHMLGNLKRWA